MKNYSLTTQAILVLLLAFGKESLGLEFTTSQFETSIMVIIGIVSGVLGLYGRWRAGGISWFGKRKETPVTNPIE